jgi:hypothetical protein
LGYFRRVNCALSLSPALVLVLPIRLTIVS